MSKIVGIQFRDRGKVYDFASGHFVGELWGFIPWTLGQVHIIEASVLAILFLLLARWLGQEKKPDDKSAK